MREHGDKAGKVDEVFHGFSFPPVNVYNVAQRLEGIEANTQWQNHLQCSVNAGTLHPHGLHHLVPAVHSEVKILEKAECAQVAENR